MEDKPGIRQVGTAASVDEQNMAQIREILFGEQNRRTSHALNRLDERFAALSAAMDALRSDLRTEGERRQAALDGVESALRALLEKFDQRLTLLDSDLQDDRHRLGQSIAEQTAALDRLQQGSVGRAQLADLLESLVGQLRDPTTP